MHIKNSPEKIVLNALFILVCLLADIALAEPTKSGQTVRTAKQALPTTPLAKTESEVRLYFASKNNGFLVAENRVLANPANPVMFAKNIIRALISGPRSGLMRTLPVDTELRAIYVTDDGTAYTDFSVALKENHPGGVLTELITIYSIVNSLVLNVTGIDKVKLLIEGREAITLAGHIDLQNPFTAEMLLIR